MQNRLAVDTVVFVTGILDAGFIMGYYQNDNYIVGWNRPPQVAKGYTRPEGLAMVVFHDQVVAKDSAA